MDLGAAGSHLMKKGALSTRMAQSEPGCSCLTTMAVLACDFGRAVLENAFGRAAACRGCCSASLAEEHGSVLSTVTS